jgi:hypothetical protein
MSSFVVRGKHLSSWLALTVDIPGADFYLPHPAMRHTVTFVLGRYRQTLTVANCNCVPKRKYSMMK